ncbi:MAG: hypothetical protein ACRDRR_18295 [Pseudonocardiaceae bacterium]
MGNLADLTVKLGVDDAELDSGLGQAESKVASFAKGAAKVAGAAGVAAGGVFAAGLAKNMEFEAANDKMAASLDLTAAESARAGQIAGDLYSDAYGSSLEEVNSALSGIQTNIGDLGSFSDEVLTGMGAKALDLASIMGEDVTRVTRGVGQLMRNQLAPDATAAFDIIAAAQSKVSADMKGELLDTIEEYGADFRELGLTGPQAMGAIVAAVQAGARNTDLAAETFREFGDIMTEGGTKVTDALRGIGLNAEDMRAKIAGGGPAAAEATSKIIKSLEGIKDPVKQGELGVALFGTKWLDMGKDAVFALDPLGAKLDDVTGAMERQGEVLNDNAQTKITGMQRSVELWTASLVTAEGPLGDVATAVSAFGGSALEFGSQVGIMAVAANGLGVSSLLTGGALRAMWAAATGPIGLAVGLIIGLVALIIYNWDTVKRVSIDAWNAVWGFVSDIWDRITGWVGEKVDAVLRFVDGLGALPGKAADFFGRMKDAAVRKGDELLSWVTGLPGRVLDAVGHLGNLLWDAGQSVIDGLWGGIKSMGSWLKGKIIDFIKSFVPGPVLEYLGISSPSKLFEGIGRDTAAGLAEGISASEAMVASAASRLAQTVSMDFTPTAGGLPSPDALAMPRGVTSAAGGGSPIRLEFTGDGAILQLIRKTVRTHGGNVQLVFGGHR